MSYALSVESVVLAYNCVEGGIQLALGRGNKMAYSSSFEIKSGVTAALVPEIEKGLQSLGLKAKNLDAVACVTGPGSFTGIRIGLATAVGLTGLNIPCAGINLLRVLAAGSIQETDRAEIWVLQYARRGVVSTQGFSREPFFPLSDPQCLSLEQAADLLHGRKNTFCLLGSGLRRNLDFFITSFSSDIFLSAQHDIASCDVLWHEALRSDFSAAPLVPLYLRPSDAVENLTALAAKRGLSEQDCARLLRQYQY